MVYLVGRVRNPDHLDVCALPRISEAVGQEAIGEEMITLCKEPKSVLGTKT